MSVLTVSLVGCGSSWKGDPFPNPFASNPAWADCDGDGYGDPLIDPVCFDFSPDANDPTADDDRYCGNPPVQNGDDCDDTYELSGAKLGRSCPDDFFYLDDDPTTAIEYTTIPLGGREFLVWTGLPVHYNVARQLCDNWASDVEVVNESASVATLNGDFQLGEVSTQVLAFHGAWRGWVGLQFVEGEWLWEGETTEQAEAGIPFCDGVPFTPEEVNTPNLFGEPYATQFDDVVEEVLVLLELDEGQRCIRNPRSVANCGINLTDDCYLNDVMCEREAVPVNRLAIFELASMDCLQ